MSDKELLKQALDALIIAEAGLADIGDADREPGDDLKWCEARASQALESPRQAIVALAAAIAQPVQPAGEATIAMLMKSADRYAHVYSFVADDTMPKMRAGLEADIRAALAQPVEVQPLTDEQINKMAGDARLSIWAGREWLHVLARDIEAAHGIKPTSEGGA